MFEFETLRKAERKGPWPNIMVWCVEGCSFMVGREEAIVGAAASQFSRWFFRHRIIIEPPRIHTFQSDKPEHESFHEYQTGLFLEGTTVGTSKERKSSQM